jgi:heme-degrading monooxygenase HmoA
MIARVWSARTTPAHVSSYAAHLRTHILPTVRKLAGYAGAMLLRRKASSEVEILVITWWHSLDAIRGFAGTDIDAAVVADEAAAVLTQFDRRVRHYECVMGDGISLEHEPFE